MTIHIDPMYRDPPRRSRWPLFLPFILVAALAVAWSGLWYFASGKAETTLAEMREREARAGRIYACEQQTISGYPFRIEVRCTVPTAELASMRPPIALAAHDLLAAVQVYDPNLMIAEVQGPLTIAERGGPPALVANWTLGQASVRGVMASPERISLVFDAPRLDSVADGRNVNVFGASHGELHGRVAAGAADPQAIDLALALKSAVMPELHAVAREPFDADVVAVLRGLKDFSPKPWADRFRELQAANGALEIIKARIQQDDVIAVGNGTLGLTPRGNLNGNMQITIVGFEKMLKKFDLERVMSEGQVGATFNQLDRILPGLGNIARQNAPNLIASIGQRTILEDKAAVSLPLRFQDGAVQLGPIPVGRILPLF